MSGWFTENIIRLLPSLYSVEADGEELRRFLKIPAATLDELKTSCDTFTSIFSLDQCDERFLKLLAALVGISIDHTRTPEIQRRQVREAVEIYRRKSSIPAIRRSLQLRNWQGTIEETSAVAIRLNSRGSMCHSRLPGLVYSLGVWRINCINQVADFRDLLPFHRPAGTRTLFLQWLTALSDLGTLISSGYDNWVRRVAVAIFDETFVPNNSILNTCRHLSGKRRMWDYLQLVSTTEILQEFATAAVKVNRFHGRMVRMRLNVRALNGWRFPNTHCSQLRQSFCNSIYTGRKLDGNRIRLGFVTSHDKLNTDILPSADAATRFCFRQMDYTSESGPHENPEFLDRRTLAAKIETRQRYSFRVSGTRLNTDIDINGNNASRSYLFLSAVAVCAPCVEEAFDIVNRWRRKGSVFRLNDHTLNRQNMTDAYISDERASFILFVNTDSLRRHRVEPCVLNKRPLNTTAMRLSNERKAPLRIGNCKLNLSGFRFLMPSLVWIQKQTDRNVCVGAGFSFATNHCRITQWPLIQE